MRTNPNLVRVAEALPSRPILRGARFHQHLIGNIVELPSFGPKLAQLARELGLTFSVASGCSDVHLDAIGEIYLNSKFPKRLLSNIGSSFLVSPNAALLAWLVIIGGGGCFWLL